MRARSPVPISIKLRRATRTLDIALDDGASFSLPAEYLRVESPSAEVQGHGPGQRKTVPGKRQVAIVSVEPIGHYAVKLVFDDGHDTGLYTWEHLASLGREHQERWAAYLEALREAGASRDP